MDAPYQYASELSMLISMGFDPSEARLALDATGGDLILSVERIGEGFEYQPPVGSQLALIARKPACERVDALCALYPFWDRSNIQAVIDQTTSFSKALIIFEDWSNAMVFEEEIQREERRARRHQQLVEKVARIKSMPSGNRDIEYLNRQYPYTPVAVLIQVYDGDLQVAIDRLSTEFRQSDVSQSVAMLMTISVFQNTLEYIDRVMEMDSRELRKHLSRPNRLNHMQVDIALRRVLHASDRLGLLPTRPLKRTLIFLRPTHLPDADREAVHWLWKLLNTDDILKIAPAPKRIVEAANVEAVQNASADLVAIDQIAQSMSFDGIDTVQIESSSSSSSSSASSLPLPFIDTTIPTATIPTIPTTTTTAVFTPTFEVAENTTFIEPQVQATSTLTLDHISPSAAPTTLAVPTTANTSVNVVFNFSSDTTLTCTNPIVEAAAVIAAAPNPNTTILDALQNQPPVRILEHLTNTRPKMTRRRNPTHAHTASALQSNAPSPSPAPSSSTITETIVAAATPTPTTVQIQSGTPTPESLAQVVLRPVEVQAPRKYESARSGAPSVGNFDVTAALARLKKTNRPLK